MSDFGTTPPPPPQEPPPPPPPRFPVPPPPVPTGRMGPPWELAGPSPQSFFDTAKGVLTDPQTTFAQMRREGGLGAPLIYFVAGAIVGLIGYAIWQVLGLGAGLGMGQFGGADAGIATIGIGSTLIMGPLLAICGLFLGSLIIHFALGLYGGQKFPYETTLRVMAYSFGSSYPLLIVPFCGSIVACIWGLVAAIIGLAQAQETTMGKSAAAVLTPTVLCCALIIVFGAAIFALIFGAAAAGGFSR